MARPAENSAKKKRNKTKRRVKDAQDAAKGRRGQAATLLQAVYRGLYGRRIAAYRRVHAKAASSIQRCYRGVLGRRTMIEERDRRQGEESGSVDTALDLASPPARQDQTCADKPNSAPDHGTDEGTLSSPTSTNSGGWWGGYDTPLGSDERSGSSIGGGSTDGYASPSHAGEREMEGGAPSPSTDDGEAWGGYFPPSGSQGSTTDSSSSDVFWESNTRNDDKEGTPDRDGAQALRGKVSVHLPRPSDEVVEHPAEVQMDTQADDAEQATPRTPLRASAPVFTPRTPLRASAPVFTPRTHLRACAPVFMPAAANKDKKGPFRPNVALRASPPGFTPTATSVGSRQPPKAELPAVAVDGGLPQLRLSTPSPMPALVPPPPGFESPRLLPPQQVNDVSIAPATKPSTAAVAYGKPAAPAVSPSGVGRSIGLGSDGDSLRGNHIDSSHSPSEGGLAMFGGDDGRFGFITELASAGGRLSTFGRRLGQGGCAVVTRLEMLDTKHQTLVDEYTEGAGLVVKIVPVDGGRAMEMAMEREIRVVKMISPRCHVNVMDIVSTSMENLCMVMPEAFCDVQHLLEHKGVLEMMSFAERMRMVAGAARGLEYLHSTVGLTHGDVKPENVLLTKELVAKLADFGLSGKSLAKSICGITKQYAAPEAVAVFARRETAQRVMLQPSLDTFSLGVMMLQVLFVEEGSRYSGKARETAGALATHGFTPRHPSFHAAVQNAAYLQRKYEETGDHIDKERFEDANTVMLDLHVNYAAQPAKMGDLRTTILNPSKWDKSAELLYQEEVTLTFLSMLSKNPLRRPSLDTVSRLLECPLLWSPVVQHGDEDGETNSDGNDVFRPRLPQDVREAIDTTIRDGLLVDPALDTPRGVWWEAPEFLSPWWKRPPIIMCIEP
ncbi:unnamed protein product [Ectocarpus fasciculatus]